MNGARYSSYADLGTVPTSWKIVGSGYFDGDGNPDILWENTSTGQHVYLADERYYSYNSYAASRNLAASWHATGAADFNGDGKTGHALGGQGHRAARHLAYERYQLWQLC